MQYSAAFEKLGYRLSSPRQDWSAEKPDGVCISLWAKELHNNAGLLYIDLFDYEADAPWAALPGHSRRTGHIDRAVRTYGGQVDVVLVSGTPGEGYGRADPWLRAKRGGAWWITKFDPNTGYFKAEVQKD